MRTLNDILACFTRPEEFTIPTNRVWAYRVGPEWRGMRHLLLVPKPDSPDEPLHPRLLQIEIQPSQHGPVAVDPGTRLVRAFHRGVDEMYRLIREAPFVDLYCPYQAFVMEREIAVSDQFDRMAAPFIAERFGLVMEWTSKSHPLRQMAMPCLKEEIACLIPGAIREDRTFRELRSLLKNGLPLVHGNGNTPFGKTLTEVVVAAIPFQGERTDLIWVTPSGREKLRAYRHFDVPEQDYLHSFSHIRGAEAEPYHRKEKTQFGVIHHLWMRGRFVAEPPHCKVVTTAGVKGMTALCRQYTTADGMEIDLVVDVRSVESKQAWSWFDVPQQGENVFFGILHAGVTDHAQHYHRPQQVSIRPELHILAHLPYDPIAESKQTLKRLEMLRRMAQELELAYV